MAYSDSFTASQAFSGADRATVRHSANADRAPGGPLPVLATSVLLGFSAAMLVVISGGGFLGALIAYMGAGTFGLAVPVLWFAVRNPA